MPTSERIGMVITIQLLGSNTKFHWKTQIKWCIFSRSLRGMRRFTDQKSAGRRQMQICSTFDETVLYDYS